MDHVELLEPERVATLEFEALVKVFFAEQGSKAQLAANLDRIVEDQRARVAVDAEWARRYLEGAGTFPERAAVLSLVGRLQADFNDMILNWATWAREVVEEWPDDLKAAPSAPGALQAVVARAQEN
ncbi:MAG: hypothetical protein ACR2KK_03315 [Acidimicrobiales bacterium]